ncbi:MAG: hypothetical protein AAFY20_09985 [Cyanobacteria bacterium J06639_14]
MNRRSGHLHFRSRRKASKRWNTLGALTPPASGPDWQETFEIELKQLETAVYELRHRFDEVRALQQQQQELKQQLQNPDLSPDDLKDLKRQLSELEIHLESSLFNWRSLLEPFWQAVRFGGLGIIIGWILKGIASN